ncbi:MAG: hypothetical protein NZ960_08475 [Candidatus Kapabacteria bacterium]|nr:hypothetical protein [Candidatus Kapabacteria bacterium]MDW8012017.1 hypothetical protein [Bacteroidota bacterium]
MDRSRIIEETLVPFTDGGPPSEAELQTALSEPLPTELESFRRHPLVRFLEYELGIEAEPDGRLRRRTPQPLSKAAQLLAERSGAEPERCAERLRQALVHGATLRDAAGRPALAFKLHQFISQGGTLYATLEDRQRRQFSLQGQLQDEAGKLYIPLKFCRQCGQDYYHVLRTPDGFVPHPVGEEPEEDEGLQPGYLMLAPDEDWAPELPEEWRDPTGGLRPTWRKRVPEPVWVCPDGSYSPNPRADAQKMWWQPAPFSLCLNCGELYTAHEQEFAKLASLSSEGRASATTILALSLLRHAARTGAAQSKLLSFTDNRQDASFQAGHFNDFVHVALLRSALSAALQANRVLTFDTVAQKVVEASGLSIAEIARNPQLDPNSPMARDVWEAFTELTEYRLYEDLQRGWRVVHPNLEQVGLLRVEYRGLRELCEREELAELHPALAAMSVEERQALLRTVLDRFRRKLAIDAKVLRADFQKQLRRRAEQYLYEFWGLDPDSHELRPASSFVRTPKAHPNTEGPSYSLNERSLIGRFLCSRLKLQGQEYESVLDGLLQLLVRYGLLARSGDSDSPRYQLNAACLLWCLGDGTPPPPDPLYSRRAPSPTHAPTSAPVNAFFQRLY